MIKYPEVKISKVDAAKRQLETAIRLYFHNADPVSIHTLAFAAHTILSDLNKKKKGFPMLLDGVLVPEKFRKKFKRIINTAKNHFKHANKDPNATVDFRPHTNEFVLLDACEKYLDLTGENVPQFAIFKSWFLLKNPDLPGLRKETVDAMKKVNVSYPAKNKLEFYQDMLSVSQTLY